MGANVERAVKHFDVVVERRGINASEGYSCINCSNVNGAEVQSDDSDIEEEGELEIEAYNE